MLRLDESCCRWMSHVASECGMLHVEESCCVWMSHVACECKMSRVNESCPVGDSKKLPCMNESCHV